MYRLLSVVLCLFCHITRLKAESRNLVYFNEEKTWLQAKKACLECGGELVDWDESVSEIVSKSDVKNTITWIGNYTVQNPWIKEEGCILESDLTDETYNFIYNNNPEFCSRTCKTDQMFAIKEERCYCIENYHTLLDLPCNEISATQQSHITVYSIGYVYNCSFEKESCFNTSFGEETMGLTWIRAEDNSTREIGNIGVENKGHYLLLEYLTTKIIKKPRILINLNLTDTFFCMTFKYYMNRGGSLEIFVNEPNMESHIAWRKYGNKGHMWYLASLDIKGHSDLTIEIYGSLDKNLYYKTSILAIDDINILAGSCNKEKRFDCSFDKECEWNQGSAWEIDKKDNSLFHLETAYTTSSFELNAFGINRHIATTYCLQFSYFKTSWNVFLYVHKNHKQLYVDENKGKINTWMHKSLIFSAEDPYNVKINGSTYNAMIKIANIVLKSGSCYPDTTMLEKNLYKWENNDKLPINKCDENYCFVFDNSKMKINWAYNLTSPLIRITSTTMFCLTFEYWTYCREPGSIRILTLKDDAYTFYWNNSIRTSSYWYLNGINFETSHDYKIVIQVVRKSDQYNGRDVKINLLKLKSGFCEKGTVYVSKRPMCPLVDSSDSSRLSVGYCSKMKNQAFICQFNNTSGITEMCKNGTHIIENVPEIITSTTAASGTTTTTKTTTLLQTNDISNSFSTLNKESSISLTKTTISNLNLTYSPSYLKKSESQVVNTGLLVVTSVLSAVILFFVLLTIYLCLKIKRNQESVKEKENLERVFSVPNRGYEVESSGSSYIQTPTNNDYELASTVKDQLEQRKNKYIYKNESVTNMPKNELESDYQNCDNFTPPKRYDSQVYQETEEGDYDHLGESDKRRMDLNCEGDNLYDHGQTIKSRNNGIYDTTKPETVDDYFVLEPENGASRESGIYDHTK